MNAFYDSTNRISFFLHCMVALFIENLTKQSEGGLDAPFIYPPTLMDTPGPSRYSN